MSSILRMLQFFVIISSVYVFGAKPKLNFKHRVSLNDQKKSAVSWLFKKGSITIKAEFGTQGWLGLGFSPVGGMSGADIVIAWVDKNGKAQISDRHAVSTGLPPVDSKQNYKLISSSKNSTHTVITFRRLIKTGDKDDFDLTKSTTNLIWAYNDAIPESASSIAYHGGNRGVLSDINLRSPKTSK